MDYIFSKDLYSFYIYLVFLRETFGQFITMASDQFDSKQLQVKLNSYYLFGAKNFRQVMKVQNL